MPGWSFPAAEAGSGWGPSAPACRGERIEKRNGNVGHKTNGKDKNKTQVD